MNLLETNKMTNHEIENLLESISTIGSINVDREIKAKEVKIRDTKGEISYFKDRMNESYKIIKKTMKEIEELRAKVEIKDFSSDIKAILENENVSEIEYDKDNRVLSIHTNYIDIFDEKGNKFRGNKYRLDFDYKFMECKIAGLDSDYCRKSWWTSNDPHPHVDGETGSACWGSAGSMLSMSMNEYELYASYIIVQNFLQQVNTDDPAGKNIRNWDCIDENDEIIDNPYEESMVTCAICDYEMPEEDAYYCEVCENRCCDEHAYWIGSEGIYVCETCYDEKYTTCNDCDTRLSNDDAYRCEDCGVDLCEDCINVHDEQVFCSRCYDNNVSYCEVCDEERMAENISHCNECSTSICDECWKEHDGELYCEECYQEILEKEEKEEC